MKRAHKEIERGIDINKEVSEEEEKETLHVDKTPHKAHPLVPQVQDFLSINCNIIQESLGYRFKDKGLLHSVYLQKQCMRNIGG
jgi:N-acetyl-gamma-glutamylphosphate reductase